MIAIISFREVRRAALCSNLTRNYSGAVESRVKLDGDKNVGFIGLGAMGYHMASNLANYGQLKSLFVCDSAETAVVKLQKRLGSSTKVVHCATPSELARKADVIITMLPRGPHVSEVYTGANGVAQGLRKSSLLLDSSTIDVKTSKLVSSAMEQLGAIMVDAPVSGGTIGAEAATLTFMVGSSKGESVLPLVSPYLSNMGKKIVLCGTHGTGQIAKICNNMLLGISMIGVAETLNLGTRLGMKPELLTSIINSSTGRCWSSDTCNPVPHMLKNVPSCKNYDGGFATNLMLKDMGLAIDAARESSSSVFLAGLAQQIYNQVSQTKFDGNTDMGSKDFGVVYKFLSERAR